MKKNVEQTAQNLSDHPSNSYPVYIPPRITTYTSQEIIELIGPAQACSPGPTDPLP